LASKRGREGGGEGELLSVEVRPELMSDISVTGEGEDPRLLLLAKAMHAVTKAMGITGRREDKRRG